MVSVECDGWGVALVMVYVECDGRGVALVMVYVECDGRGVALVMVSVECDGRGVALVMVSVECDGRCVALCTRSYVPVEQQYKGIIRIKAMDAHHDDINVLSRDVDWLVVFYVPSTATSFRDGTPIYCPLRRT